MAGPRRPTQTDNMTAGIIWQKIVLLNGTIEPHYHEAATFMDGRFGLPDNR
jgi:hypothetical protein